MKSFVFTIACCLAALCTQAQEVIDTVQVRVQYRATYKHTQEQKETFDDTNLLDIGKHASRFYRQAESSVFTEWNHSKDNLSYSLGLRVNRVHLSS